MMGDVGSLDHFIHLVEIGGFRVQSSEIVEHEAFELMLTAG